MRIPSGSFARTLALVLFMASHLLVIGCNDPSRTTGTMVEESEEAKAYRQKKMETMKKPNVNPKKGKNAKRKVGLNENRRLLTYS